TRFSRDWSSDVCSSDLIPGTLLRRTLKGELPLMEALQELQRELTQMVPSLGDMGSSGDDPLAQERRLVEGLRKLTLMVAGLAVRSEERRVGDECRAGWT